MTKVFLLVLSIPAFMIFVNSCQAIAKMGPDTSELIRWSNILIAFGAGSEIAALVAVYSIDYGTWAGIKMMLSGAIMLHFGYSGLYLYDRRRKVER